jgi:hypothetical protein
MKLPAWIVRIYHYYSYQFRTAFARAFTVDKFADLLCPGCGLVGPKKLRFMPEYQKVIAICNLRCGANWGAAPVLGYDAWKIQGLADVLAEQQAVEDEATGNRERDELGIRR